MGNTVLFVDDEQRVLDSIKRTLRQEKYSVEIACGGREGIRILGQCSPGVVVTDMRMPEMDGIGFLREARALRPEAVYMVLSAYSDLEKIMAAINEQHVWRYIAKPWESEELKQAIQNAMEMFEYREGKKVLLASLEEKNRQLEEMNSLLEEKVRERTLQLQEKNEILQLLVENSATEEVMTRICRAIGRRVSVSPVFIDAPFLPASFSDSDAPLPPELKRAGEEAARSSKAVIGASSVAVPLVRGETILGTVLIPRCEGIDEVKLADISENYLPAATLCLMLAKNLCDAAGLPDKIEKILGDL